MKTNIRRSLLPTALVALMLSAAAGTPAAALDDLDGGDSQIIGGVSVADSFGVDTQRELSELLASSTPKTVNIDAGSGAVLSVAPPLSVPLGYSGTICLSTDLCLLASQTPYANAAFNGSGTWTGSWDHKSAYRTGDRKGQVWWYYNLQNVVGPTLGAYTQATFSGAVVLVTKVKRSI